MSGTRVKKARSPLFRALGAAEPPEVVEVDGEIYDRVEIYKHDSWAATARYASHRGVIICKFNRVQPVLFFPMSWLGRRLAARERHALERLADLPTIPDSMGDVRVDGKIMPNAVARRYVSGHPLMRKEFVSPRFFQTLKETLAVMHDRGMAYVDLHKRENIIVGDDGQPYLIDFQICLDSTTRTVRGWAFMPAILDVLCQADRYHLTKHVLHHAQVNEEQALAQLDACRPWWISAHRRVAVPFRELRRKLLVAIGIRKGKGRAESEHFAEDAVRREVEMRMTRMAA